jgi:hypothetical protein
MPEVAICTENVVTPAVGAGILSKSERQEYSAEYFFQHLAVFLLLLISTLRSTIHVFDLNW